MEDLDGLMDDQAIDEFVKGVNVEFGDADEKIAQKLGSATTQEELEVYAAVIVDDDDMMYKAIFGQKGPDGKIRTKAETIELLVNTIIAGKLITKDKSLMQAWIDDRFDHMGDKISNENLLTVTRSLMNQFAKL